ncbi:MAG TPA: hypothetical protein EYP55_10975 [Anaerolineae bacterium]|nr:hypothetical protein [Anaerolineae bacterium]
MSIRDFIEQHPHLTAWAVLAVGMVAILLWTSKDVDLLPSQRAWLVVATILLAGACVWIISWEEGEGEE